jgi:superoxide dismutase
MKTENIDPKKELLLGAGLDVLHQESRECQETIAFWKDETKFFANLLAKKEDAVSEYGTMLKNSDKIHEIQFDNLSEDIVDHEKFLSRLEKGEKGLSDGNYREQHRKLNEQMELFFQDFKDFKRMVFGYAKKL